MDAQTTSAPAKSLNLAELWRLTAMAMIARGHMRVGREMLKALRDDIYDGRDIDATTGLGLAASGDFRAAISWVQAEVLRVEPLHPLGLLTKAVSERAIGHAAWKNTAQLVLQSRASAPMRNMAEQLLRS
jgi:hypothetical protein